MWSLSQRHVSRSSALRHVLVSITQGASATRRSRICSHEQRRRLTDDGRRLVLGIESSCDDSCAALVSAPVEYAAAPGVGSRRATIHNSIVRKQDHGITRGVQPLVAANAHSANVPLAIRSALQKGQDEGVILDAARPEEIDAIAVTQGPGMAGCLAQGLSCAKLLSTLWQRPLLHVHHMVAHALTPFLTSEQDPGTSREPIRFPFLVFLLSGGHTQLVLCSSPIRFRILADCRDNSIGNVFDKVARLLNIPFAWGETAPGAALERFAGEASIEAANHFKLPISFRGQPEFSYSGLLASVTRLVEQPGLVTSPDASRALAYAFQKAAFAQIQDKLKLALQGGVMGLPSWSVTDESHQAQVRDIVVSGGVASNGALRKALYETLEDIVGSRQHDREAAQQDGKSLGPQEEPFQLHFPPIALCTDNAAMIAHAGLLLWEPSYSLLAEPRARWSLDDFGRSEE